jgi:hypothetical protein
MRRSLAFAFGIASAAFAYAQPDMAAMQKWLQSETVNWSVVGQYDAETAVSSDQQGLGQVKDRVEFHVTVKWLSGVEIVGEPQIRNSPAVVGALRDREPKCLAPTLKGPFDYATLDTVTQSATGVAVQLKMTTTFPDAVVSQVCSSTKNAPAGKDQEVYELFIPQPTFLALGMSNDTMQVSSDKSAVLIKNPPGMQGWTWTLTPSL